MTQKPNILVRFWQELKQRNVVRVTSIYAAAAFSILQLVDLISRPLNLPESTITYILVFLGIGLVVTVIVSWIYEITPSGVIKTEPVDSVKQAETKVQHASLGWKLATYISVTVAVGLVAFNLISKRSLNADILKLEKSIALLPFRNESPVDSNKYFINGIMEEILNDLSVIKGIRVLSRTSTDQFLGPERPTISEIAKKLAVNYLVEGSGEKYGNTFRLRVQLLRGRGKETHLWGKSYEKEIHGTNDIFSTQSEIAQSIALEIKATITPDEKQIIKKSPTSNLIALDLYQRGVDEFKKYWPYSDRKALERAKVMFNKALANDSTFAKAYLGLAWVFWNEHYYETLGSKMFLDSVLILSNLAIKFDNQLSEAYTARGDYYKEIREPVQALEEYDKAIKLNPNSWQAYLEKGWLLWDYDVLKCIENLQIAISLNHGPEMAGVFQAMGIIYGSVGFFDKTAYYYNEAFKQGKDTLQYYKNQRWLAGDLKGDYAKAVEFDKKILAIDSINLWNYYQFMCDYMHDRQSGPAFRYLKEYMKRKTGSPSDEDYFGLYAFAWVYLQNGNKKEAIRLLNLQIEKLTRILEFGNYTGLFRVYHDLACAYALLGENKKTYDNLRLFLKEEGIWDMYFLNLIKHNPPFDAIRNQTEFRQIVEELESRQQKEHERVRKWLEEKGML